MCVGVCVCACMEQGQGDRNGAQDMGVEEGFSTFLYLCNQREEKFLWLFLRVVCFQDLGRLSASSPSRASLGC